MNKQEKKKYTEFSKVLLIQESILIWVITLSFLFLAFLCVILGYLGSLPWLSTMIAFPWTAYGVSQACYYNKSKAENCHGVTYQKVMAELSQNQAIPQTYVPDIDSGI